MSFTQHLQDQYIKVGSVNTRYWQLGEEGSEIVLLHGGGGYIELWKYNIFELAKHHRVYAFDMVGAGRTDKPDAKYTFDFMAKFTHSLMEALNIPHANLIGASAGGGVALTFALKFPNRVDKLVIVGSAGLGKEVSWLLRLPTIPLLGELLGSPSRSGLAMLCKQAVYDPKLITNEVVEEFYQMATIKRAKEAMLSVGRENFNVWGQFYQPIVEKLNTITAPTLIIWGRQDKMVPVSHAYNAAKNLTRARLEIIESCGHWSPIEHPQKFNQLVLDFLADVA
ncbi:alpha/beta fold hydrolase [Nostoc sp. FACHB-892]|uniref:alpha/beta fold hydrolase n=1 Tax=Nostoc sp. FACHB-892 TaxID=2692843 RepID=UPI001685F658|nr:alpha/beta fold hydrolase [Nostoc sp. FACHB-892]MBD2730890.1 alpha/beta fold hydrolase [Nostoc sp. FACHB-892]